MRISRIGSAAIIVGLATLGGARRAHAYGGDVHMGIVSMAWETMRAASDPNFTDHIAWNTTAAPPAPLSDPLACDFCGGPPLPGEWSTFIGAMPGALVKLNSLQGDLPASCPGPVSTDGTLKGTLVGMSTNSQAGSCTDFLGRHLQGGAYDGKWHPGGIFDATAPNPAIDGFGYQGLALGWHAKSGDDDLDDGVFTGGLVTALVALALIAVAVLAVFGVGGLAAFAAGLVVFAFIALCACIYGWLSGDSCKGDVDKVTSALARDTGLEGLMSDVGNMLNLQTGDRDSVYTGMWHFINANGAGTNSFDDRRGLFYNEAGPDGVPGQLDLMAQAGLDIGGKHLDFDLSKGPKQYEIRTSDDGHPNSVTRDESDWEGVTGGHLQFSPLDNFAYFGWRNFRGTGHAGSLRWPLHAIGDATVPHHVSGTSSWGHRPFESALDYDQGWSEFRLMKPLTAPELLGANVRTCFPVTDPSKRCPEDDGSRGQVEQARRVLQHALRWHRFIQAWRTRTGRTTDLPVREMITTLAQETRAAFDNDPTNTRWPFCDDCSFDYQFNDNNNKGRDYYRTADIAAKSHDLVERAIGATVAFLLDATDAIPTPAACAATACSGSTPCCRGTCQQGQCCGPATTACDVDSDCCAGLACRNGQCGDNSVPQGPGDLCEGGGAGCAANAHECLTTPDGLSVCCQNPFDGDSCTGDAQCCSGHCGADGLCGLLAVGQSCANGLQCQSAGCYTNGNPVNSTSGPTGTCCNHTTGSSCNPAHGDADCCVGVCKSGAGGLFKCEAAGCSLFGTGCQTNSDCCSGTCGTNNATVCACSPTNFPCSTTDDCCQGTCSGSVCQPEVVK